MKTKNLKASALNTVLAISASVTLIILVGGFYFAQNSLRDYAAQINGTGANKTNQQTLKQIEDEITATKANSEKINSILASNQTYQTTIENDLKVYATANGIKIANLNLSPTGITGPLVGGVRSNFITITLSNPVSINNLLRFMQAIDTNLPKMQITSLVMTPTADKNSATVDPIALEVYSN